MVTYGDLFLFCTFVVALIGLCYTVFKGRKWGSREIEIFAPDR